MGNIISRINGASMATCSYDEVITHIRKASRPMTVHFLRKRGSIAPRPRISVVEAPAGGFLKKKEEVEAAPEPVAADTKPTKAAAAAPPAVDEIPLYDDEEDMFPVDKKSTSKPASDNPFDDEEGLFN